LRVARRGERERERERKGFFEAVTQVDYRRVPLRKGRIGPEDETDLEACNEAGVAAQSHILSLVEQY